MDKMQELYQKVSKDGKLQETFKAIMSGSKEAGDAETEKKLAAFAKEAGYEVSLDEMRAFFKKLAEKGEDQLSDSELDMVAGGKDGGDVANSIWSIGIGC